MLMTVLGGMWMAGLVYFLIAAVILYLWKFNSILYLGLIALLKYSFWALFIAGCFIWELIKPAWLKIRGLALYQPPAPRGAIPKHPLQKNP